MEGCARLVSLYAGLIRLLPSAVEVCVVLKARAIEREVKGRLAKVNPYVALRFIEMPSAPDIFIREWAPVVVTDERAGRPLLFRRYFREARARCGSRLLAKKFDTPPAEMPLAWAPEISSTTERRCSRYRPRREG
jgi:hypothetical protein